jgi:small subunit ribosomal protein S1
VVETVHTDAVLVHLPKSQREGFAPARDLRKLDSEFRATLEEGDHVPVRVLKDPGSPADVVVSLDQEATGQDSSPDEDWARAEELLRNGQEFEATVTGFNRGGVVVAFGHLEGFVPNSHLERSRSRDREAKANLVGQTLSLGVLEVDRPNRRLVLSRRPAGEHSKEQILSQLEKGQVHTGVVRNLVSYGAFVDLGGMDGLIHISELDWRYVDHPSEVLSVGDEVEVYVLDVDRERSRISLSRKYLLPRPWDEPAASPPHPKPRTSMVSEQVLRQHQTR